MDNGAMDFAMPESSVFKTHTVLNWGTVSCELPHLPMMISDATRRWRIKHPSQWHKGRDKSPRGEDLYFIQKYKQMTTT